MASDISLKTQSKGRGERSTTILKAAITDALSAIEAGENSEALDLIGDVYSILLRSLMEVKAVESER
jgi:hypothetical protein